MVAETHHIQRNLTTCNFKTLFIEELGLDALREAPLAISVDGQPSLSLATLVEKCGFGLHP